MLRPSTAALKSKQSYKTIILLKNFIFQQTRAFTHEIPHKYEANSTESKALEQSLNELTSNPVEIPIAIGEIKHHTGDIHLQAMPHNWRCNVSRMSWANRQIVKLAIKSAKEVQSEWCATPLKERIEIWLKCADILAKENRHRLNAAIMLGQGKTLRQAEEDTCRTINDMRYFAELLSKDEQAEVDNCTHLMRATGGFIAAITPFNWTSNAAKLALCPALMGNCVLWKPSQFSALSCYFIWEAMQQAQIPDGVINFVPSNPNFFVYNITRSRDLAGINYAGAMHSYRNVARTVSEQLDRHQSFASVVGPKNFKNFHFVHESADVESVAAATALAAYDYSGQRGSSCEILIAPISLWCDLKDALIAHMEELKIGDVSKFETKMSPVINKASYDRVVGILKHTEESETCRLIYGGNHNGTHGYFIEPTLVECNSLNTHLMRTPVRGPMLAVYVYEDNRLDEIVNELTKNHKYTLSAAVFAEDERVAEHLGETLSEVAANFYINKPCIGSIDGQSTELPTIPPNVINDANCQLHHWLPMSI